MCLWGIKGIGDVKEVEPFLPLVGMPTCIHTGLEVTAVLASLGILEVTAGGK